MHIHHIDEDKSNNNIENLEMLTVFEHFSGHGQDPEHVKRLIKIADKNRHLAKAWHASEEGRQWHSEHGKLSWKNRKPKSKICDQCQSIYATRKSGLSRFCSNKCKSAYRRDSGIDDIKIKCVTCDNFFTVNKYSKQIYCSRGCIFSEAVYCSNK